MPAGPRARWGFHRLADNWAQRIVRGAGIEPGALVVDIGAGTGALTAPLVRAGARVVAVERHPGRARLLRQRFGAAVVVVEADASELRLPRRPYRVVANPPFAVSTAVLRRLLAPGGHLVSADIVLPASVAARWASGRGIGADRWGAFYRSEVVARLPPDAFTPTAPMATSVLRIERVHPAKPPPAPVPSRRGEPRRRWP